MHFTEFAKRAEKLVTDNSPAILTAIGVTGTLTTAYLTGTASFKAADIIASYDKVYENQPVEEGSPETPLDARGKTQLTWKLYIPAIAVGTITVVAIIGANRIGTRRAAAVAAAYSISEKAFVEYKDKVIEKIGENKEREVRDEIAQDRVSRTPLVEQEVIMTGIGDILCLDSFSGRYFKSDMESLRKAQNDINQQILHSDYATVSNFYNNVGLEPTTISEEMGWNTDKLLELHFSATLREDKTPCMVVDFAVVPIRNPWQFC